MGYKPLFLNTFILVKVLNLKGKMADYVEQLNKTLTWTKLQLT
jgi:hypothetical protein